MALELEASDGFLVQQPAPGPKRAQRMRPGATALMLMAATSGAMAVLTLHHTLGREAGRAVLSDAARPGEPVSEAAAVALARMALLRLEDANRTGDYAVFRKAAAASFQSMNSEADLARIFAWMREKRISLSRAALLGREALRPQSLEPGRVLRIAGEMPLALEPLNFDLLFQEEEGEWRLFGIAVFKD